MVNNEILIDRNMYKGMNKRLAATLYLAVCFFHEYKRFFAIDHKKREDMQIVWKYVFN